ncbi:hypothetical protein ACTXT7_007925 [Hymenolepis weldensis]
MPSTRKSSIKPDLCRCVCYLDKRRQARDSLNALTFVLPDLRLRIFLSLAKMHPQARKFTNLGRTPIISDFAHIHYATTTPAYFYHQFLRRSLVSYVLARFHLWTPMFDVPQGPGYYSVGTASW